MNSTIDACTKEALYDLVKYVSSLKDQLDGPYDEYCQPEEKRQLLQAIASAELITTEPEFMTESTLKEQRAVLFSLGERIADRHREAHELRQAADDLREVIKRAVDLAVKDGPNANVLLTLEYGAATLEWLDEQLAKQARLARNVDPVLQVEDITARLTEMCLIVTFLELINGQDEEGKGVVPAVIPVGHLQKLECVPDGDPDQAEAAFLLGLVVESRFDQFGVVDDMNEAVTLLTVAVRSTMDGDPDKVGRLTQLGDLLAKRFELYGDIADIHRAISSHADAVRFMLDVDPSLLNNLGFSLTLRFERLGDTADIEKAISYMEYAADIEPDNPRYLSNLGVSLRSRFSQKGDIADLDRAIYVQRNAVRMEPHNDANRAGYLGNLAASFGTRFGRRGDIADVDAAISSMTDAVCITSYGHPSKTRYTNGLGTSFMTRFERLGDTEDINRAISHLIDAVQLSPDGHPNKARYINGLGTSFLKRFEQLGDIEDIDRAIAHCTYAVQLTPDDHPNKADHINGLGTSFLKHFEQLGDMEDLGIAIANLQDAICLSPDEHPDKPRYLTGLANSLTARFERLGELADADMAISIYKEAISTTPADHPDKSKYLSNLAIALIRRYEKLGNIADCIQGTLSYAEAARSGTGPLSVRFRAAVGWSNHAKLLGDSSVYEAYNTALCLLPQLARLGLTMDTQYQQLREASYLACQAAATVLNMNNPQKALEWLEQGRSVVWARMLQFRTPFDDLRTADPELANKLAQLSVQLVHGSSPGRMEIAHATADPTISAEQVAQKYRRQVAEWEESVERARILPGFEQFLQPKQYFELRNAACAGPVVVLNISPLRCDALILVSPSEPLRHIKLDDFSYKRAEELQGSFGDPSLWLHECGEEGHDGPVILGELKQDVIFRALLKELWTLIVEPVLNCLSLKRPASGTDRRRIWWCPTGPLAFLPLHAAGIYSTDGAEPGVSLADYAISSYTPTLTALISALKIPKRPPQNGFKLLAVLDACPPGYNQLPGTDEELVRIQRHISDLSIVKLEKTKATTAAVLSGMKECHWIHFACHGIQDIAHPMKSGLVLHDGRLGLSQIVKEHLPHAEFAFLSASETATGDKEHPDEAIHLAAGMLVAGCRSVIATMFLIRDCGAPFIADEVYARMIEDGKPSCANAASALHAATQLLRKKYNNRSFASWVPFIHIGV